MERYFILMIITMLTCIGIQTTNPQQTGLRGVNYSERKIAAAVAGSENPTHLAELLSPYRKLKTHVKLPNGKNVYHPTAFKHSIKKINWRRAANKMTSSTNPRVLFNILHTLPMGEPYFIQ